MHIIQTLVCLQAEEDETARLLSNKQELREKLLASLPAEPPIGSPNTVNLLVRLPDGSSLRRRFPENSKMQVSE